jgi:hypothetical protein
MDDYISKQAAIDACFDGWNNSADDCAKNIKSIPAADVAPVVHARWIKYTGMGKVQWMCSKCSAEEKNPKVANYCYHCGAKMDGDRKE